MGLFDFLGKFMSKAMSNSSTMKSWEENMTMEEIEDLERQGCDMTEYRRKYAEREAAKAAEYKRLMDSLDLAKLNEYMATPRDMESDFVKDTIQLNKIGSRHQPKMADAKIVYAAVVQAHSGLWKAGDSGQMGVVFVLSMNEEHMHDQEWLLATANKISEMKNGSHVPNDNLKFIKLLRDDQSMFVYRLGESLSGSDDETWCLTYAVDKQAKLPNSCLPPNRILPLLVLNYSKKDDLVAIELIPAKYFTK